MKPSRWGIVFIYVILIFSAIPYVPKLWEVMMRFLGQRASAAINAAYVLTGLSLVFYSYFKLKKTSPVFYAIVGVVFLCYAYILKGLEIMIERIHLFEYTGLSLLLYWATEVPAKHGGRRPFFYVAILGVSFLVGLGDEVIQKFIPARVYEFRDVLLNWKASALGLILCLIFERGGRNARVS